MWFKSIFKRDDSVSRDNDTESMDLERHVERTSEDDEECHIPAQDTFTIDEDEFVKREGFSHKFILWTINLLSGDILSKSEVKRHYPYVIFLLILALLYITHIFSVQQLHREHLQLSREIKDLRAKSLTISSYRMQMTRHSSIIKMLNERGSALEESLTPNIVISK